jgi:hypothetical protein
LDIDEELYACFIDWQKVDRVKWSKLMQILVRTGINWCEGRLISKLYIGQGVKLKLDGRRQEVRRLVTDCIQIEQRTVYTGNS